MVVRVSQGKEINTHMPIHLYNSKAYGKEESVVKIESF